MSTARHLLRNLSTSRFTSATPWFSASYRQQLASRAFHASAANMTVHEIKSEDEFQQAIKDHKTVVLDAWATWCGPCKAISPFLEKLSNDEKFKDIYFAKFDVDDLSKLAAELGIRAMPTFLVFVDGKKVDETMGANPPKLTEMVTKFVSA